MPLRNRPPHPLVPTINFRFPPLQSLGGTADRLYSRVSIAGPAGSQRLDDRGLCPARKSNLRLYRNKLYQPIEAL